ncbi:MAG TPA: SDR family oxidoreductase [Longimicrobiaceae bacterium]|jgi:NAD(P)-dependent dehydrogenase (short-subunit alcohol dehydrogenase family)|nr:SDR family oxidoreductase [Longimicrobiaceae bacterium]
MEADGVEGVRGKTVLVTGGSRGIGLAVSRALVRGGAWVGMVARTRDELARAAAEAGGHAIPADVSSPEGVHGLANYVAELLGDAPDVIVNCAGAFSLAPFAETDPADFDRQLDANLRGPFLVTRAFLPLMLRRRDGLVVNVGSVAGRTAFPRNAAYSASKFGLRGMHEVLLQEIRGTGVRATLVEPAATDTPLWDPLDPDQDPDLPSRAGMLRPEDVARVVLFAVSQPRHVEIPVVAVQAAG